MDDAISHDDAEKTPEEELDYSPAWYIPHHGIHHHPKPGKIRVVFNCSASFCRSIKKLNKLCASGVHIGGCDAYFE